MAKGGFLRTNYSRTGAQLDVTAIGGGAMKGSWGAGSGLEGREWGGLIMGSINCSSMGSSTDFTSVAESTHFVSAQDAMASYWGAGLYGAGYKIVVFWVGTRYTKHSILSHGWASTSESILMFLFGGSGQSGVASTQSARFQWAGFIASGPNM